MTGLIQMSFVSARNYYPQPPNSHNTPPQDFLLRTLIKLFQSSICEQKLSLSINQNYEDYQQKDIEMF